MQRARRYSWIVNEPATREDIDFSLRGGTAPRDSLWQKQEGADFFLPPSLTMDTVRYMDPEVDPLSGIRNLFSLPR